MISILAHSPNSTAGSHDPHFVHIWDTRKWTFSIDAMHGRVKRDHTSAVTQQQVDGNLLVNATKLVSSRVKTTLHHALVMRSTGLMAFASIVRI